MTLVVENVNALMTAPVEETQIELHSVTLTLRRTNGHSFYLQGKIDGRIVHVRDRNTHVATFSRNELVQRLLDGNYEIG